jgi:hypothetical protein
LNLLGNKQIPDLIPENVVCLVYVDDMLFYSSHETDINIVLGILRHSKMELNVEDKVASLLGVLIKKLGGNRIELT